MTWQQLFGHSVIYGVRTGWWAWHAVVTLESAWKLEEGDGSLFSRTFKLKASLFMPFYIIHCRTTIFWYQIHWINPGPQWSKTLIWPAYLLVSIFNFPSDIILQYNHYCCVALAHMLPHEACQVRGCLASRWFQLFLDMLAFFFLLVHLAYLQSCIWLCMRPVRSGPAFLPADCFLFAWFWILIHSASYIAIHYSLLLAFAIYTFFGWV